MLVKNTCGKIIGFGRLALLPGVTDTLPSEFEGSPVVKYYIDTGRIEIVQAAPEAPKAPEAPVAPEAPETPVAPEVPDVPEPAKKSKKKTESADQGGEAS
jgi:hypothetical protein